MLVPYTRAIRDLVAYDPFRTLGELERAFFSGRGPAEFRTDIRDEGDHFLLEADLPGFNKEDIHVDLDEGSLTITAERRSDFEQKDKKGSYVRCERAYGSYARSFDTSGIDTEHITAAYKDGVLRLTMPKLQKPEPTTKRLMIE